VHRPAAAAQALSNKNRRQLRKRNRGWFPVFFRPQQEKTSGSDPFFIRSQPRKSQKKTGLTPRICMPSVEAAAAPALAIGGLGAHQK
jgi:hypothetical protein